MNLIAIFVQANRRAATWVENRFPRAFAREDYAGILLQEISTVLETNSPRRIVEAGGVDRPLLSRGRGYEFIGVDIDDKPNCRLLYDKFFVQSVEDPLPIRADMIVSITLLEHVPDNAAAMRSFFNSLEPFGTTHHYIPSKWHPYSIALRIVGPTLQKLLIRHLRPAAMDVTGYPTYFNYCDPGSMEELTRNIGFVSVKVRPFYGAADYFAFFLPAYLAVVAWEAVCKVFNLKFFASGFVISAMKPGLEAGNIP